MKALIALIIILTTARRVRRKPSKGKEHASFNAVNDLLDAVNNGGPNSLIAQDVLEDMFMDE